MNKLGKLRTRRLDLLLAADFRVRRERRPASKWIADAIKKRARNEWPADILSLFGTWAREDFPSADELRKGYVRDATRVNV